MKGFEGRSHPFLANISAEEPFYGVLRPAIIHQLVVFIPKSFAQLVILTPENFASISLASACMATPVNNSVIKAFRILNAFRYAGEKLTLSQVARRLDLNIATVHRFLTTLDFVGAVVKTPEGAFELGLLLAELGGRVSVVDAMNSIAQPHVEKLVEQFGETIHAAILDNDFVCYVAKAEGSHSLKLITRMGARLPAYCTGLGKALLSMLTEEERAQYARRQSLTAYTKHTVTDPDMLLAELKLARERGYAFDNEEMESGLACVAVPIIGHAGNGLAALSLSAPSARLDHNKITEVAAVLKTHAALIADKLESTG